jgi:hypothetical protein
MFKPNSPNSATKLNMEFRFIKSKGLSSFFVCFGGILYLCFWCDGLCFYFYVH